MNKIIKFISSLYSDLVGYLEFLRINRQGMSVVIYAESAADYPHFKCIMDELLRDSQIEILYVTSDRSDPLIQNLLPASLRVLCLGNGLFCTLFFRLVNARVFVMTLPDLDRYHLKRSVHSHVNYVYVFHSLVSSHMIYREGALDYYDTYFCSGPHHEREIRLREKLKGFPPRKIIHHGYGKLDQILEKRQSQSGQNTILIAPSWGDSSITNTCLEKLVDCLLTAGKKVIFRPHPMSVRLEFGRIKSVMSKFGNHPGFVMDDKISGMDSFFNCAVMISEWSGAALEYAFGRLRPVLFVDTPPKANNPNYALLGSEPVEISLRSQIGHLLQPNEIELAPEIIDKLLSESDLWCSRLVGLREKLVYNLGQSGRVGAEAIKALI